MITGTDDQGGSVVVQTLEPSPAEGPVDESDMNEELTWLPAWRIRELVAKREVSPVEVTEHFLGRFEEHDAIRHTFLHVDGEGALRQARAAAVVAGEDLGPLHGIPISVKSHMDMAGLPKATPTGMAAADPEVGGRTHPLPP